MLLICSRMLLQFAAIGVKKSLADDKITACVKDISWVLCTKFWIEKHCLVKHFAFLKKVCFYELLIGQQPTFLECIVIFQ